MNVVLGIVRGENGKEFSISSPFAALSFWQALFATHPIVVIVVWTGLSVLRRLCATGLGGVEPLLDGGFPLLDAASLSTPLPMATSAVRASQPSGCAALRFRFCLSISLSLQDGSNQEVWD